MVRKKGLSTQGRRRLSRSKNGTLAVTVCFLVRRQSKRAGCRAGGVFISIGTIILIILVIALLGGFSGIGGGPFYGTGYYGGGGLGPVVGVLVILLLMGRLESPRRVGKGARRRPHHQRKSVGTLRFAHPTSTENNLAVIPTCASRDGMAAIS